MALINTAGILAGRRGFRVLVLDLDLEAPGLSYLDPELPDVSPAQTQRQLALQPGFVDLLTDAKARAQGADLFTLSSALLEEKYTQKIKIPDTLREFPDGSLRIMPAGLFDRNYAQHLDGLNLNALYRDGLGEPLIRAFKKKFVEAGLYDYVLVDSRTGMSEGAGICTRDLADHLMILSGLNRQNVEGTCEFLREFRAATGGKKGFQIILSPIPNGEDKLLDDRRTAAARAFQEAWGGEVDLSLEIPYHPQLALTEEPHIFRRRRGYLFEAYRTIEARMLDALGHNAHTFHQRIMESLEGKDFEAALRDLGHMIRLDRGQVALSRLADNLTLESQLRQRAETEPPQEPVTFEKLLREKGGRSVAEFIVNKLSLGERDWLSRRLLQELERSSPYLAKRLVERMGEAAADNANGLGNYALSFEREGKLDVAEAFYKKAIEADPKHPKNLWNYGDFLEKQRSDTDGAEAYYSRAIEADPKSTDRLGRYALFRKRLGDMNGAEAYFKLAIDANPQHAGHLGNYAIFLRDERGDKDGAEAHFKRAIEADPENAHVLGSYALFLARWRGDKDGAEAYYRRAIEIDRKHAGNLSNYGQDLAGFGELAEAEKILVRAFRNVDRSRRDETAEVCFSLWLVLRMRGRGAQRWEQRFKFLIQQGFKRSPWDFDLMLQQAKKVLPAEELEYAKALATAFLDESKVADLAKYPRWQALEPLPSKARPAGVAP